MDLEQLLRQAWNSGMGSHHDTKTSKQLKVEEDDFIDSMEDELNLFSIHNVSQQRELLWAFVNTMEFDVRHETDEENIEYFLKENNSL